MRYKLLGPTGLKVSEFALGTMTFGEGLPWGTNATESKEVFHTFLDKGGNFIDTADAYTNGASETMIGELSKGIREQLVIATKYSLNTDPARNSNAGGNHRRNMIRAVEGSLKRLQTDYIDLYWVHLWDQLTPVEEMMRGLDDLVSAGKILYTGISDAPAWVIAKGNMMAEWRGWNKFAAVQMEYNLIDRGVEREVLPLARHDDLSMLIWSPLAMGLLTGKYRSLDDKGQSQRGWLTDSRLNEQTLHVIHVLLQVAAELNASPAAVALRWLQYQYHGNIPIIGARTVAQLEDNLSASALTLSDAHLQQLHDAGKIDPGFPYDIIADERVNLPGMHDAIHGSFKADMLQEVKRRAARN